MQGNDMGIFEAEAEQLWLNTRSMSTATLSTATPTLNFKLPNGSIQQVVLQGLVHASPFEHHGGILLTMTTVFQ